MKRVTVLTALIFALLMITSAHAVTYTFNPYDNSGQYADIDDLNHYKFYVWEINNFSLAANEHEIGRAHV